MYVALYIPYSLNQTLRLLFTSPRDLVWFLFESGNNSRAASIIHPKRNGHAGTTEEEQSGPFMDTDKDKIKNEILLEDC